MASQPDKFSKPDLPPKPMILGSKTSHSEIVLGEGSCDESRKLNGSEEMNKKPLVAPRRPPSPCKSPKSSRSIDANAQQETPPKFSQPAQEIYTLKCKVKDKVEQSDINKSVNSTEDGLELPLVIPEIKVTDNSSADELKLPPNSKSVKDNKDKENNTRAVKVDSPREIPKGTMDRKKGSSSASRKYPIADGETSAESSEYDDSCCMPTPKIKVIIKNVLAEQSQPKAAPRSFSSPAQAIYGNKTKPSLPPKPAKPPPRPKPPDLSKKIKKNPLGENTDKDDEGTEDSQDYKDIDFKKKEIPCESPYKELRFREPLSTNEEIVYDFSKYHAYEEIGAQSLASENSMKKPDENQYERISVCAIENLAPTGSISELESVCGDQSPMKGDGLSVNEEEDVQDTCSLEIGSGDTTDTLSAKGSLMSEYLTPAMSVNSLPFEQKSIDDSVCFDKNKEDLESQVLNTISNEIEAKENATNELKSPDDTPSGHKVNKVPPPKPAPPKIPKKPKIIASEIKKKTGKPTVAPLPNDSRKVEEISPNKSKPKKIPPARPTPPALKKPHEKKSGIYSINDSNLVTQNSSMSETYSSNEKQDVSAQYSNSDTPVLNSWKLPGIQELKKSQENQSTETNMKKSILSQSMSSNRKRSTENYVKNHDKQKETTGMYSFYEASSKESETITAGTYRKLPEFNDVERLSLKPSNDAFEMTKSEPTRSNTAHIYKNRFEDRSVNSSQYSFYTNESSGTIPGIYNNISTHDYYEISEPNKEKKEKKSPPARPPPPQPKRPPRSKKRSKTTCVTRDEIRLVREKLEGSRRSKSLTEADLAKRVWMTEKPFKPPIDIKTLYTKVQKDPSKNVLISIDDKLRLDLGKLGSGHSDNRSESFEVDEDNLQSRPLPPPPAPPRTKRRSEESTPSTAISLSKTPCFTSDRAKIEAEKLKEISDTHLKTRSLLNGDDPSRLNRDNSPSIASDLSSAYDALYPKARCYDDGDVADESNLSSQVVSMDEEPVANSDDDGSSLRNHMSSVLSSRSNSSRKREEKVDKKRQRQVDLKNDNSSAYHYQFEDKSETSDTESSIKIRIRIEKKTEKGGEGKVVVKRSIPIREVMRSELSSNQASSKLSPSDSLSQIPDLVSFEEAGVTKNLENESVEKCEETPVDISYSVPSQQKPEKVAEQIEVLSTTDSWHSALDTSSESEGEEEADGNPKTDRMFLIAKEITSSEQSYVRILKLLNQDFRKHVLNYKDSDGWPVMNMSTFDQFFKFLPQLQILNENLLLDLCNRIDNWNENPCIADILVKISPYFKIYSSYMQSFESMNSNLDDLCSKNTSFANCVKEFEMSEKCRMLTIKHHMLKPVQRVPQYKLFLERYIKYVPENCDEYTDAQSALSIISKVADHINKSIKDGDNFQKLIQIQSNIIGNFEVIRPGRMFLKEGWLNKLSRKDNQPRWFILFNDCLLYMSPTPQGFKINYNLPLSGLKIMIPTQQDYQNEFSIISFIRSFSLSASSQEERKSWIDAINTAISQNVTRRNTFNTGSKSDSEISSITLGHQAPVWIPDARVTMCQICTTDFTVTFRRHHCRACGKVVCKRCSSNKAALRYRKYRPARVCDECYEALESRIGSTGGVRVDKTRLGSPETESDATETETSSYSSSTPSEMVGIVSKKRHMKKTTLMKRKNKIKSALEEVTANDQSSDISGYLLCRIKKNWKKSWFVVKENVLYTYRASEDVKALQSTPLLGYQVSSVTEPIEGVEGGIVFQLNHRGRPAIIFHTENVELGQKWIQVMSEATVLQ